MDAGLILNYSFLGSIVVQNPYNRNNPSLFNIPEWLWNPDYQGERYYYLWSVHTWIRNNRFLPSYQVWINYHFRPDPRGLMRAQVKNIWSRSSKIEIYCKGVKLEGDELKEALTEIRERLCKALDYRSLRDKYIRRYIFNYVAAFTDASLSGLDCHHESHDNAEMRKLCADNGMQIREEWLAATDDRISNLYHYSRLEHKLIHYANGDANFFPYLNSLNYINNPDEMSTESGDTKEINITNGNEVNKENVRVSGISYSQLKRDLWQLYLELEFDKYPFGNLSIPVMQT